MPLPDIVEICSIIFIIPSSMIGHSLNRCGPCQYMVPVLNEVGHTMKDTINVIKVDTEKYPSIANRYRVEALPTLIIFRDGKPSARFVSRSALYLPSQFLGACDRDTLRCLRNQTITP